LTQACKEAANTCESTARPPMPAVRAADAKGRAASMGCQPSDRGQVSNKGLLVIASRCWSGSARRVNMFHQLNTSATQRAMIWQRS